MPNVRSAVQMVEPTDPSIGVRRLAQMLEVAAPVSVRNLLEASSKFRRIVSAPLALMQQNLGLFSSLLYNGKDRNNVLDSLITNLLGTGPDVVGLSEFWVLDERAALKKRLEEVYPYSIEGPPRQGGATAEVLDGGLLLLSKHPIVQNHATVYHKCTGEDCFASKGILHACIQVPGHPTAYDIFLSHTQNPGPKIGSDEAAREDVKAQLGILGSFIRAYNDPHRPALLMGDLNTEGGDLLLYKDMLSRLNHPQDLWLSTGRAGLIAQGVTGQRLAEREQGITFDQNRAFDKDFLSRHKDDPERHKHGSRLDYLFSCAPNALTRFQPLYDDTEVVVWESSPGRDISDHYGLRTKQKYLRELAVDVDIKQPIMQVTLSLTRFHCLVVTDGTIPVLGKELDDDEIGFELRFRTATGTGGKRRSALIEDINTAKSSDLPVPVTLTLPDPGEFLDVEVEAFEIDTGLGIETGRVSLGPEKVRLDRSDLLRLKGLSTPVTLPVLKGDGGEYIVTVTLRVE